MVDRVSLSSLAVCGCMIEPEIFKSNCYCDSTAWQNFKTMECISFRKF